ncbi:MAG: hypothetical protein IKF82_01260 [Bacilli bacterium]|nr:hypothetical protein [Bacilli bacterium]
MVQNKRIFWARFVAYAVFGLAIPMAFLIWRFNLFSSTTKLNIGGWGIIVIVFTAVFLNLLLKQAIECVDSQLAKRILNAVRKVFIPLLAVTLCLYAVDSFVKELVQFFIVLTICEPIAYGINPMPDLIEQKQEEQDEDKKKNTFIELAEVIWSRKNK